MNVTERENENNISRSHKLPFLLLTPWNRVLLQKLILAQEGKKSPAVCKNIRLIALFT
jgi:hypothetical protein